MASSGDAHVPRTDEPADLRDHLAIADRPADSGRPAVLVHATEATGRAALPIPSANPDVQTVVLCDDQRVLRDAISLLLTNFPRYRVVGEAMDAASCRQAIVDFAPDILIMDVSMPGGGPELVRAARAQRTDMHIVMFSGRHEESLQVEMIAAGADVYVVKTGRLKPLIEALDSRGPKRTEPAESTASLRAASHTDRPAAARTDQAAGPPAPCVDPRPGGWSVRRPDGHADTATPSGPNPAPRPAARVGTGSSAMPMISN